MARRAPGDPFRSMWTVTRAHRSAAPHGEDAPADDPRIDRRITRIRSWPAQTILESAAAIGRQAHVGGGETVGLAGPAMASVTWRRGRSRQQSPLGGCRLAPASGAPARRPTCAPDVDDGASVLARGPRRPEQRRKRCPWPPSGQPTSAQASRAPLRSVVGGQGGRPTALVQQESRKAVCRRAADPPVWTDTMHGDVQPDGSQEPI